MRQYCGPSYATSFQIPSAALPIATLAMPSLCYAFCLMPFRQRQSKSKAGKAKGGRRFLLLLCLWHKHSIVPTASGVVYKGPSEAVHSLN
jgi:hypothetical protein